ncbi:hypothetical protein LY90DRAFT_508676 [Neocallimastix californiae]|uniref:Uncharacterized protein n=1 Tax=Neocallimastix californiae TaxID=1754190 RepID=A0A1Y2CQU2_9FUNG|nr:hypothetical protein LY90DRAFT_508676 [Neocallimastix californiae]|eukprot:ORY49204.1 hypothetical protein LY90DRAFT_508676 [Neocallimastix californiae]
MTSIPHLEILFLCISENRKIFPKNDINFINEKIFQNDENNYVNNSSKNDELDLLNNNDNFSNLNSNTSTTNGPQCNHNKNKNYVNESPSLEGIKTIENNTENFENSSHNNSKNNSDMPDSPINNDTTQIDIKMGENYIFLSCISPSRVLV